MTHNPAMSPWWFSVAALAVLGANWTVVSMLVEYAPRLGLLDRPNNRSMHTKVTPRGGGLGFVLVVMLVTAGCLLAGRIETELRQPLIIYLVAACLMAAVGLWDDFRSLSPAPRFLCQLAAAVAAVAGVAAYSSAAIPALGVIPLGWVGAALTVLWIVGLTNVYNFMDGIDGIAGVQGTVAGLAWMTIGIWTGSAAIAVLGLLLAMGCAAFLLFNWSPAKIFMGDVGSAFLGYSFAVLPLLLVRLRPGSGAEIIPWVGLLLVWPFVGDGFYTFVRRARRGEVVWKPHRSHLYQRLVQSGWTHASVSTLYAGWGLLSAGAGVCWYRGAAGVGLVLTAAAVMLLPAVCLLVLRRERRKDSPA